MTIQQPSRVPSRRTASPVAATHQRPQPRIPLTQLKSAMNLLADAFKTATPAVRNS